MQLTLKLSCGCPLAPSQATAQSETDGHFNISAALTLLQAAINHCAATGHTLSLSGQIGPSK